MTEGVFPKCDGCCFYASEANIVNVATETALENAMNIASLQFCQTVTDIDHDYLVVDVMSDNGGYNNTICNADSTADYNGSDLTGAYENTGPACDCVVTEDICFDGEVEQVYLTAVNAGTGTILYNVVNATGGATLCSGLSLNCQYSMSCCVCCIRLEFAFCTDALSCLRNYALAVVTV